MISPYHDRSVLLGKQKIMSNTGTMYCDGILLESVFTESHHSVFYRLDALPVAHPTASKH